MKSWNYPLSFVKQRVAIFLKSLKFKRYNNMSGAAMKKFLSSNLGLVLSGALILSACATLPQQYIRYRSNQGGGQSQFMRDRYDCIKETQQRVDNAYIDQYQGSAQSAVLPSCAAFRACLAAKGYIPEYTTNQGALFTPGYVYVPQGTAVSCQGTPE